MLIKNNTHYFSLSNKLYNLVPDPHSWEFESARRLSYSQRLYWEFKYTKHVGGQAFFYTFTYNNKSLPHYTFYDMKPDKNELYKRNMPCFNYDHIRLLTNGLISKELRRKYGSQLRYFVACERGEGKGVRGKGLNPHYHVIFFISPLSDKVRKPKDPPYKRISPIRFCHLCKAVWQYQLLPGTYDRLECDYKSARFGHCQPGDDLGLVTDFDALSYVTKYVCKDSALSNDDCAIKNSFERHFKSLGYTWHSLYFYYQYLRLNGLCPDRQYFLDSSGLSRYIDWRCRNLALRHKHDFLTYLRMYYWHDVEPFWINFFDFFNEIYLPQVISQSYRQYYNQYGAKVRTSKSLGVYGLNFVRQVDNNPHFVLDTDKPDPQPICLYYYRKLYMDVVKCPVTGNPLYVLNQNGIDLKCCNLQSNISKLNDNLEHCISFFGCNVHNSNLWSFASKYNITPSLYAEVASDFNLHSVLYRYSVYRYVYQYRHYSSFDNAPAIDNGFSFDNILRDYAGFLKSNFYTCDFEESSLIRVIPHFMRNDCHVYSFLCHPLFSSFKSKFDVIERFYQCYIDFLGDKKKRDFDDGRELRQRLNSNKYISINML